MLFFPQCPIQLLRHCLLHLLIEIRIVEQFGEGIVVIQETLGHNIPELVWKQGLHKHLCAVILCIIAKFFDISVLHEHLVDSLDNDPVGIGEIATEAFVHLVDDAL